jgi:hypothetical protein
MLCVLGGQKALMTSDQNNPMTPTTHIGTHLNTKPQITQFKNVAVDTYMIGSTSGFGGGAGLSSRMFSEDKCYIVQIVLFPC